METTIERPSFVTDEHLDYLNRLRQSGEVNMFGAALWVAREFGLPIERARQILVYWMESFEA